VPFLVYKHIDKYSMLPLNTAIKDDGQLLAQVYINILSRVPTYQWCSSRSWSLWLVYTVSLL